MHLAPSDRLTIGFFHATIFPVSAFILFVDHALAQGGAEYSLLNLMRQLDPARYRPVLACASGLLAQTARAAGISVAETTFPRLRRNPRALLDIWRGAKQLALLARRYQVELIHSNTVRAALYAAVAAKMAGVPFVWHVRDCWLGESKPRWVWADAVGKQILLSLASAVIANSKATATYLPTSPKVRVVYNGIDLALYNDYSVSKPGFRSDYGIPPDVPLVGFVGRLRPWKGQADFLQAMARVNGKCPNARFVVAGGAIFAADDDYPAHLQRLAQDLGIDHCTLFTGQLDDARPVFAALDVFVHCGQPEPFGLVNIEAMALATPVVAYAHGALPEIVVDGQTGLLVQPYDQAALANAVLAVLNDAATRQNFGLAGTIRVAEQFTIQQTASEVMALYDQVLKLDTDNLPESARK
jgi:glycosyltransferase involved in cell wall biosynthesis